MARNAVRKGRVVKRAKLKAFKTNRKGLRELLRATGTAKASRKRRQTGGKTDRSKSTLQLKRASAATEGTEPTNEVAGMEGWAGLGVPLPLLRALGDLGFQQPTEVQRAVLPIATDESCDIIAAAETGSGKTLAFSIPVLRYILSHCRGMETKTAWKHASPRQHQSPRQRARVWEVCVTDEHGREVIDLNQVIHSEGGEGGEADVIAEASESDSVTSDGGEGGEGVSFEIEDNASGGEESHDESHDQSHDRKRGLVGYRTHIPDDEFFKMLQGETPLWASDDVIEDKSHDLLEDQTTEQTQTGSHDPPKLLALIMTPTRELALQIRAHIAAITKHTSIKVCVVVGGMATEKQERLLRQRPPVVIATPGRLWQLMSEGDPHLCCLDNLRYLVLDEADRMIEFGHYQELGRILDRIKGAGSGTKRCNFVFSATLTLPRRSTERKRKRKNVSANQTLENLMTRIQLRKDAHIIDLTGSKVTVGGLTETKIMCTSKEKDSYLYYFLLKHPGRTLVFINSIESLQRVKSILDMLRLLPRPLHSNMQQRQRMKNLERFTADPTGLLIATDVAARGLDIPQVQHVIHYHVPKNSELYVHRSGRTARGRSAEGLSLLLVAPEDLKAYRNICQTLNRDKELENFPVDPAYHQAVRERVNLANQIEALEHRQRRGQRADNWLKQSAEAMDIELDEELLSHTAKLSKHDTAKLASLKAQLAMVVKRTLMPKGISLTFPSQRDQALVSAIRTSQRHSSGGISQQKDALTVAKKKRY